MDENDSLGLIFDLKLIFRPNVKSSTVPQLIYSIKKTNTVQECYNCDKVILCAKVIAETADKLFTTEEQMINILSWYATRAKELQFTTPGWGTKLNYEFLNKFTVHSSVDPWSNLGQSIVQNFGYTDHIDSISDILIAFHPEASELYVFIVGDNICEYHMAQDFSSKTQQAIVERFAETTVE